MKSMGMLGTRKPDEPVDEEDKKYGEGYDE